MTNLHYYYEQDAINPLAKVQELLQSDKSDAEVIEQLMQLCGIQQGGVMDDLCKKCKNFEKCLEDNGFDDCVDNDYINYKLISNACEGCFHENWSLKSGGYPCSACKRQSMNNKKDNYISKKYALFEISPSLLDI